MSRIAGYVSGNTSQLVPAGTGYGEATGGTSLGTRTVNGQNYTVLEYTSTAQLTIVKPGFFDILLFGGGACGANQSGEHTGGGGGGGGWRQATVYLSSNISIVIGAGTDAGLSTSAPGIANPSYTNDGQLMALGGGNGGMYDSGRFSVQCGNGGGNSSNGSTGHQAWANGFNGGARINDGNGIWASGGGGGAGGAGSNAFLNGSNQACGGAGGPGKDVSTFIGGSALYKGAGGGGGGYYSGTAALGGNGIGGTGGLNNGNGGSAAANTASGGGGCGRFATGYNIGGSGGSGIAYVRFRNYT